jgi:phosphoribosylamine---glycine ligase
MRVLLIGGGGREHALAWKLLQSPRLTHLTVAPGNAGIAQIAPCVPVDVKDNAALVALARDMRADFVVVAPDDPLANGAVDALSAAGYRCFGPTRAAAQLEWSKGFTKDLCAEAGIPTARYGRFAEAQAAKAFARTLGLPVVIKADGLALGKGVVIAASSDEADAAIDEMLGGRFGASSRDIVAEEFLHGAEASLFALCDGTTAIPFGVARDHKRAFDGDKGPNTGGMGCVSFDGLVLQADIDAAMARIVEPTLAAMRARGTPFKGVLFAGLMLTQEGPKLIEYNARFGDPETQVLMLRFEGDLLEALERAADGTLAGYAPIWSRAAAVTVVMAANGYPEAPTRGTAIAGLDRAVAMEGVTVFHAGTARDADGVWRANGGRVLNVSATGATAAEARARAYAAAAAIDWPDGFCRSDIAAGL